jgi:O-antigen/teichoic acid export membrane protein
LAFPPAGGAARASAWSAIDVLVRQGLQFVVSVVLARLLSPADFGLMALLAFFTGFGIVIEAGLASVLVQRKETTREQESALFWIGIACSLLTASILVVLGPVIAGFFEQEVLEQLMWLAGAQVIAMALGIVPIALLTKAMRFHSMAKIALAAAVVSSALGVGAATMGAGVWALGLQFLTFTAMNTIGAWSVSGWRPLARIRGAGGRVLFGFSSRVSLSQLVDHLYGHGATLLIGKLHGLTALGIYNRGQATQYFASGTMGTIVRRLALPLFASRADDTAFLRDTLKRTVQIAMVLNLPMMVGLAITSDLVILILFGAEWASAAPILSVLALAGIFWPLQVINSQLLLAIDRPDLYWQTEIIKKGVGIFLILGGSIFGIMGLAWSQVAFGIFAHFFNGHFSGKHANYGSFRQIRDVGGTLFLSALMAVAVLAARPFLDQRPVLLLASMGALGAIMFCGLGLLLRVSEFRELQAILKKAFARHI